MTGWYQYIQKGDPIPEWPYPIKYDEVNEISADVLIIGGGIAGCHAAINAAREGAKVVVVEKGNAKRSGLGGAGVDHWNHACTNPCSKVTPKEWTTYIMEFVGHYLNGPAHYIAAKESWDALLDCEQMGVRIRDEEDEFKGADFRDDETRLMFSYDYVNKHNLRVWGHNIKPCLYKEMKRLGVTICDRIMMTSLLNENGAQGARIVGATGVNVRTGAFYIFTSKAAVITTAKPSRNWMFQLEQAGGGGDLLQLNMSGDGHAAAWKAGAAFVGMESAWPFGSGLGYIPYGVGNADNTWHGTTIVDSMGKEVAWADMSGRPINTREERNRPGPGEKFIIGSGVGADTNPFKPPTPRPKDMVDGVLKGEYVPPFYADLPGMPKHARRVIFGMMVGNEGKTRISVYDKLTKAGFDPDRDMLQVPVLPPEGYMIPAYWIGGINLATTRNSGLGGFWVDWDLRTSLEGLYSAGESLFGHNYHAFAAATGRYAGRNAARYALSSPETKIDQGQIDKERARCYAPVKQDRGGAGWKELNAAITRIMLDYCGMTKNETVMQTGLSVLKDLKETEAATAYAANPHELGRLLECHSVIATSEMVLNACLARKGSNPLLMFTRHDYPETDPAEWSKWLSINQQDGEVKVKDVPLNYHLQTPFASDYEENYSRHGGK